MTTAHKTVHDLAEHSSEMRTRRAAEILLTEIRRYEIAEARLLGLIDLIETEMKVLRHGITTGPCKLIHSTATNLSVKAERAMAQRHALAESIEMLCWTLDINPQDIFKEIGNFDLVELFKNEQVVND